MMGKMIVLTAPSGGGKTTIKKHLLEEYNELGFSISVTTREKRPSEIDGKDYYFRSTKEFNQLIEEDAFLEWEEVYKNQFYGTLKSEVDRLWALGKHIVFDVDVHGAQDIKKMYGDRCMAVFIRPPSIQVIVDRLKGRETETAESLAKRVRRIEREMSFEHKFDKVLINDLLLVAFKEAENLVESFLDIHSSEEE
jgi:guanylate kinase